MFHVFQGSNNETRYPNDLVMLNYPDLLDNFRAKRIENLALYKAFFAKGQDEKGDYLNEFIAIREYRKSIIGDIITQEYYTETIEGLAEYAGCMALKQISSKKYEKRMKDYIGKLVILDNNFFDHRRLLYYSGAVFCIILKEMNINIHHQIGSTATSFFEIISEKFIPKSFTLDREDDDLLNIFKEYVATKGERFTTSSN